MKTHIRKSAMTMTIVQAAFTLTTATGLDSSGAALGILKVMLIFGLRKRLFLEVNMVAVRGVEPRTRGL